MVRLTFTQFVFASVLVQAQTSLVTSYTPSGSSPRNDITAFLGMQIKVGGSPVTVTALGRVFAPGNKGAHTVKLVYSQNSADVPAGSVTVNMTNPATNG